MKFKIELDDDSARLLLAAEPPPGVTIKGPPPINPDAIITTRLGVPQETIHALTILAVKVGTGVTISLVSGWLLKVLKNQPADQPAHNKRKIVLKTKDWVLTVEDEIGKANPHYPSAKTKRKK